MYFPQMLGFFMGNPLFERFSHHGIANHRSNHGVKPLQTYRFPPHLGSELRKTWWESALFHDPQEVALRL
ncbi:MAG: hypothetical protein J5847_03565, partial [Clostridia bacterium]|nr:hypothetical protein [Clostridia bacterium]